MGGSEPEKRGPLLLGESERSDLWRVLIEHIEDYLSTVGSLRVTPQLDPKALRRELEAVDFSAPLRADEALGMVVAGLRRHQVHTPHPRYYGLFNPATSAMSIAGDALAATYNPQLAAWSHSPFAVEIEQLLVRRLGERFGYAAETFGGTFASGGAEANHTSLLLALSRRHPGVVRTGLRNLRSQPVLYISSQGHHSFHKAARISGLGDDAVREIPVDDRLRMSPQALVEAIAEDKRRGCSPFLVVATAGTTAAGIIDDLPRLADIAVEEGLWFHVDAAWGGAAVLVPELASTLAGVERADSITFDAHKWLSVPMGAGLFLTRHPALLERTFRVPTGYMPREAEHLEVSDPYACTIQWSRRFIGLKLFLTLAVAGWEGYAEALRHQVAMADLLRRLLRENGWKVVNQTPLPLVCFVDWKNKQKRAADDYQALTSAVLRRGEAWLSTVALPRSGMALRACITNFRTAPEDVEALLEVLEQARSQLDS